ncbi:35554_t:CDS:1 [Gigaspora margarita]|uniref:35554_t:CDS:1 n=1 Tax=Gigaspora margarita TaxID=4874 RepID=A0ABN7WND2_GIGMA|nr:35554_t:CDS:1 [Gigaspora margarita]
MSDYIDKKQDDLVIKCHYLASAPHLIHVTTSIKKILILYINGEFILYNNESYVYIKNITFSGYQRTLIHMDSPVKILWKAEISEESSKAVNFAKTIATKFNSKNGYNNTNSSVTKFSTIKPSATQLYVIQSFVAQLPVIHSTVIQPFVTQPFVAQPSVAQPSTTQTYITQSSVTQPLVIHSSVTQPFVTQPSITQPSVI